MVRPVEGFITSQGKFFDEADEAEMYEAKYELTILCERLYESIQGKVRDQKGFSESVMNALWVNRKTVKAYIKSREAIEKPDTELVVETDKTDGKNG